MALGSRGKNVELRDQDLCNSPILLQHQGQVHISACYCPEMARSRSCNLDARMKLATVAVLLLMIKDRQHATRCYVLAKSHGQAGQGVAWLRTVMQLGLFTC